jgi:hypothetical protein
MPSRQVDPLFTPCSLLIDTSRYFISIQDQRRQSLLLSTSQPCANLLAVLGSKTARNRTRGRSPQASAHRPGNDFAIFVRRFAILDGFGFIAIPANHESPQTLLTQTSLWKVRDKRKPVTVSGMISSPREPVTPVLFPTKLVPSARVGAKGPATDKAAPLHWMFSTSRNSRLSTTPHLQATAPPRRRGYH